MRALFILLAFTFAVPAGAAEVYRCVTENGVVRYSDKPCTDGKVDKLAIENRPTDPAAVEAQAKLRAEKLAAIEKADTEAAKAAEKAAGKTEERAKQCAAARERLQRLLAARKVTEGQGEDMKYLEAEEIVKRRQEAQDNVNKFCSN